MKKMIRRLCAIVLCLAMVVALMPKMDYVSADNLSIKSIRIEKINVKTFYDSDNFGLGYPSYPTDYFESGDKLFVTYDNNVEKEFTCYVQTEYDKWFVNGNDRIDINDFELIDFDGLDIGDNIGIVTYQGKSCTIPIVVIHNTVDEISFKEKNEVHIKEKTNGKWEQLYIWESYDWYYIYDFPGFQDGDEIIVNYEDQTYDTFVFNSANEKFISNVGGSIEMNEISISDEQEYGGCQFGNEIIFTIKYHGRSCSMKVIIDENSEGESKPDATTTTQAQTTTVKPITTTQAATTTGAQIVTTQAVTTTEAQNLTTQASTTAQPEETTKQVESETPRPSVKQTVKPSVNPTPKNNKKISIKKIKSRKKSLKVTWKKVKGVKGYHIQASLKKKFKKCKTVLITNANKESTVIKKLGAKKKYFVRMRTYIEVGGIKYYSPWSKAKKKKTK